MSFPANLRIFRTLLLVIPLPVTLLRGTAGRTCRHAARSTAV